MIIVGIIGFILFFAGIGLAIWLRKPISLLLSLVGCIIYFISCGVVFVPTGYVGIRTAYGQISDKPVKSGANWHTPFLENIHLVNCKQQEKDFGDLRIWSETSERTEVYCENVVIDYQIDPEWASWIWCNVEEWDTNLVKQTSIESGIKSATKMFNDTDVTDRSKIESAAKDCIQKSLNTKYKNQIVNIVSVAIGNINFSDAYNSAIEKKAQAKLAAEAEEYANKQTTQRVQAEADQKKIQAEGEAEAKRIAATADAEAIIIKAEAQAEANEKLAASLTPELLDKQKIDKWDGSLPTISGAENMILDVGSINN